MPDLLLDSLTHDLVIENGDLVLLPARDSGEAIVQRIKITLLTQLGEWAFDTDFGVPYLEEVLVKNPDLDAIQARMVSIVLGVEGVTQLISATLNFDELDRQLDVFISVDTREGAQELTFAVP